MTRPAFRVVAFISWVLLATLGLSGEVEAQRSGRRDTRTETAQSGASSSSGKRASRQRRRRRSRRRRSTAADRRDAAAESVNPPAAPPEAPEPELGPDDESPDGEVNDAEAEEVEGAADLEETAAEDGDPPIDIAPLQEEFTALMDEIVQVRSRVAALGRQLFRTRVRVAVENEAAPDPALQRIALFLDESPIFRGDASSLAGADGARQVFDGFAAPGPHVLRIEVEQRARADDSYRYEVRDSFRFQVLREKLTYVEIRLDDGSDIAESFEDDEEGEYDVRTTFRVSARSLNPER